MYVILQHTCQKCASKVHLLYRQPRFNSLRRRQERILFCIRVCAQHLYQQSLRVVPTNDAYCTAAAQQQHQRTVPSRKYELLRAAQGRARVYSSKTQQRTVCRANTHTRFLPELTPNFTHLGYNRFNYNKHQIMVNTTKLTALSVEDPFTHIKLEYLILNEQNKHLQQ